MLHILVILRDSRVLIPVPRTYAWCLPGVVRIAFVRRACSSAADASPRRQRTRRSRLDPLMNP